MTSRIEADGESKEAKWADIDDDEDDWAPETIEWADGTKVTLNHGSNVPLPPGATKLEKPVQEEPKESQPVRPKAIQTISSVGPNATVLKLGASAERQQAQKATILQKGPSEKPTTSSAKSPAPVPAKSPWAPLPPVEKVSPITINPQFPIPPPNRYSQAPLEGPTPSMAMAPSPAKEISADDFNRSWRDSQTGQPRELFMPNSGRYEAVNDNRRRGSRNDQNFRASALLQRPAHNQHAPAEPSAAFQTSRISGDQERGPWNRRRASLIHSAGSGQYRRRMSVSKGGDIAQMPPEMPLPYMASSQIGATDVMASSGGIHVQQNINLPPTSSITGPPGLASEMAVLAEQKRVMQETARLAVQRRREEEQKEEAARKERIRLKLEQLGPLPDQKAKYQEQKAEATPKSEEPVQISSPPKPPVPEASGEPKQYGMMKVHHPDNVKKFSPPAEKSETLPVAQVQNTEGPRMSDPAGISAPIINGIRPTDEALLDIPSSELQNNLFPSEEGIQSWKSVPPVNEPVPGWSSRSHLPSQPTSNLWGPPSHDKALGNGTFDQRLTGLSARDLSIRSNSQQQRWFTDRPSSQDQSPQMPSLSPMPHEKVQSVVSMPSSDQRPLAANTEADFLQPGAKPLPRGTSQAQTSNQRWQQPSNIRTANNGAAAWNNFHAMAVRDERAENERFQRDLAASLDEEAKMGIRRAPMYTFNETWKQVEIGEQVGDRQVTSVAKGNVNPSYGAPGPSLNGDRATNGLPIRGSRFFPTEARRAVTYSQPEISRSPSPPPAEELGSRHPAYDGDSKRPVINFPVPKAVVKLPRLQQIPSPMPPPPAPPRTFAAAAASQPPHTQPSLRSVSQPLVSTPDWQHRFNDLLGRKSPPKKHVLAVASSTREPLDVVCLNVSAAVSLPPKEADRLKDAGKVTSRDVEEEEDLFEDREVGSSPLVQIPRDIPENMFEPAQPPQLRPKGRYFRPEVDPVSISSYDSADETTRGLKERSIIFYIHLPGSPKSTKKTMPNKTANGFPSKGPKPHSFNKHNNKRGLPKSRESSGSFQNVQQQNTTGRANNTRTPPAGTGVNGSVPTPRSGFSHNSGNNNGWKGGHFASTAGMAH